MVKITDINRDKARNLMDLMKVVAESGIGAPQKKLKIGGNEFVYHNGFLHNKSAFMQSNEWQRWSLLLPRNISMLKLSFWGAKVEKPILLSKVDEIRNKVASWFPRNVYKETEKTKGRLLRLFKQRTTQKTCFIWA